ncbi:unnamed protein product [Trichogramma brassicae]|uniref:Uncharacterized protein n=1 Tax=Trichogramma brassicae TaxID=86971 RepID=A0A6H5IU94_9HYME|nr:unnamed protein product [Trichogramma brassicae]
MHPAPRSLEESSCEPAGRSAGDTAISAVHQYTGAHDGGEEDLPWTSRHHTCGRGLPVMMDIEARWPLHRGVVN